MASYAELDINQKINYKATVQAWLRYSVRDFQGELDRKVYGLRISKRGIQRSSLGKSYRFGSKAGRTNQLRRAWWQNLVGDGERAQFSFMMYGRYLDMGVGKGTSHTDRLVHRQLRIGSPGRQRRAWYSKRKSYEIKRLREILAEKNIHLLLDTVETGLSLTVKLNL